ncbi:hexokinase type 2 isoform X3 [Aethina tumida]|uniref:hexokinase type 2 isoform X3 n=1 Tax=Aethina tumida TaxID=116153 RepID=UPI0021481720|nr:hexokinase type 2 isoform X3 [Aethina tumida]
MRHQGVNMCTEKIAQNNRVSPIVKERLKEFVLDNDKLRRYIEVFTDHLNRGLGKATNPTSIVKCFPTYVQDLPNGQEKGKFLALDLGGTNFRVLCVELDGEHCEMNSKIFAIPQHIMVGTGEQLFDHIAECMHTFVKEEGIENEVLPLGFTFSFPLIQKGLTVGILQRWTKGFKCSGVEGEDVVKLLEDAIERRGDVKIDVCAILNDTTGTLMSCAWKNHDCGIGLIIGTGSNSCYVEKQANAELFDEEDMGSGEVLINTEWGAFGDDGALDYIRTEYDEEIDRNSINVGTQKQEKMISGMYMGELVRLVTVKLIKEGLMFGGKGSDLISKRDNFYTKYVSEIESDAPGTFNNVSMICEELGLKHATEQDYINLRYICECISRRAAHLVSAGLVALLHKMGKPNVTVGVDGSVYRFHPTVHDVMVEKMTELCDPNIKFQLMLSEDGSGRGAALVAAVAARKKREAQLSA